MIQIIEHEKFTAGMRKDGIVHVLYKNNTEINIPLQNDMVAVYSLLCGGNKFPFLFEVGKQCSITKDARD